ncbi:hypothetical protein [Streptomyces rishiriensis]|uniref:hypothetical protein n=1 Tax=Streptomyces rishiriensis TaxID=68264 RepID=UPI0037CEAFB2
MREKYERVRRDIKVLDEPWSQVAAEAVERLGLLETPPQLPDIPEPRADGLKPFLGHWSPYGP